MILFASPTVNCLRKFKFSSLLSVLLVTRVLNCRRKDFYFIGSPLNLMMSAVGFLKLRTISDMSSSGVDTTLSGEMILVGNCFAGVLNSSAHGFRS